MEDFNQNSLDLNNAKHIYKKFKADKIKNANIIIDLLLEFEGDDPKLLRKAVAVTHKIFCQLIKEGDIKDASKPTGNQNAKEKYDKWLYERYLEVHEQLFKIILNIELPLSLREVSLLVVIKFIKKETLCPVTREKLQNVPFPLQRLTELYRTLLSADEDVSILIRKLKEYFETPDFLSASLFVLAQIIPSFKQKDMPPSYPDNLCAFLDLLSLPDQKKFSLKSPRLFICDDKAKTEGADDDDNEDLSKKYKFPYKEGSNYFNIIWDAVLKMEFTTTMYKRCLILLPEKVLKHLNQPVRLTDYFINAYNMGGVISLLALHGVYILVTQYNLEYPDFYDKLYALFDASIFQAKYKARFFMLCNKFFMSPYLPEYVVAAFIKRCSRLMLTAPSSSLILLLKFVVNLLLRFPSLKRLIHNPDAQSVENDPFVADEPKPQYCRAGESSLWEVATLREHPLCGVSKAANFINRNLPDVENDLSKFVDNSYEDMYNKASKIREPRIATTFYKPEGLFNYSDDTMSSTWSII